VVSPQFRDLIGPLVLYDESTRPDFVKADAVVKTGDTEFISARN
jgi:hypothetical protein